MLDGSEVGCAGDVVHRRRLSAGVDRRVKHARRVQQCLLDSSDTAGAVHTADAQAKSVAPNAVAGRLHLLYDVRHARLRRFVRHVDGLCSDVDLCLPHAVHLIERVADRLCARNTVDTE